MKLLVVSHPCVVDVNQHIYHELELMGHQVAIVVPNQWRHEYSERAFRPARLRGFSGPLIALPVWKPGSVPLHGYIARLDAVLARTRPDVIYIEEEPYSIAAFQWALAASRAKIRALFFTAQNIVKKYPLPFRLSEQFVWGRTAAGVCVTANIAQTLKLRGYQGQTFVIPHAVDLSSYDRQRKDPALSAALGLRSRVVAYLGRLVEEKGLKVLLEAYRRLPMRQSTSLLCIGTGPLSEQCCAEPGTVVVERLPHSEVPKYLTLADLVVLPSLTTPAWKEQFGRAAIEAMACGLPVVGSSSGEIPNVIADTSGGVVVAEGDAESLKNAVTWLLEDSQARRLFGAHGRAHVEVKYATRIVAKELATALGLTADVIDRSSGFCPEAASG